MTDGMKTALTLALLAALFMLGAAMTSITGVVEWRLLGVLPFICMGASAMVFRWPSYMYRYFSKVSERDSERGVVSIHTMGVVGLVVAPVAVYLLFFG
ncbi:hypothetical protein LWH94_18580 [Marinobacter sp. G11]|uniref:hypothetical protein n=1 Tax=Marinobacter sp. G11 TaxID=2903522 RepID=UPI00079987C8|nr:hypothetical protein [Marinobacter sp. G11]KXS54680.1 MAG: hypothetical protein AWU57_941 [Marinobacter sp. T13-3]MCE0761179.1 hypothetical protein [Marinobacter sp. G11]